MTTTVFVQAISEHTGKMSVNAASYYTPLAWLSVHASYTCIKHLPCDLC